MKNFFLPFFLLSIFSINGYTQAPKKLNSGEIYNAIKKLNFLGSVLYIAAHPDDENTRLISYFSNELNARTAYLSLTRGDGGQNLIGHELREFLGVIRTEELLEARGIDGGEQFFTRANDFGYSKNPEETFAIWNKEEVLNDVVSIIRKFKPDVIINRFDNRTPGTTHGHHTSSALLSVEAFDLSGDSSYKTLLKNDEIWQPKRLFFNTSWWFYGSRANFEEADKANLISFDIGNYYSIKGLSNNEIAALSRSRHQSQGFGATGERGSTLEYLEFLKGTSPKTNNIFEGVNTSWSRVEGGQQIGLLMNEILKEYNFENPSSSLPKLLKAYKLIQNLKNSIWKIKKTDEILSVIQACAGLYIEAIADNSSAIAGETIHINIETINRSTFPISISTITILPTSTELDSVVNLINNQSHHFKLSAKVPLKIKTTAPYWLLQKGTVGMYKVSNTDFIGLPETPRAIFTELNINFNGVTIPIQKPIVYKLNDPVKGEVYKPFEILPQISTAFKERVSIFLNDEPKEITLKLKALKNNEKGVVSLKLPSNWKVIPDKIPFEIKKKEAEQLVSFQVFPPKNQSECMVTPQVKIGDSIYSDQLVEINYSHIPFQSVIMPAEAKWVRLNLKKEGQIIGYIQGAGDDVPNSLRQLGYTVIELKDEDITSEKLKNFDAVVLGIRAYNTNERAPFYQKYLHEYVNNGGTLIVQYNTNFQLEVDEIAPYKLTLSRDRVTDENSEVTFINQYAEILNYPNKITQNDFEGWVQERGLYFPSDWDAKFTPILTMHDKNEPPLNGSLLVADYGKGYFIYTGLSFFRELPEGVPGAYKLFANMLSIGKNKNKSSVKN